MTGQKRGVRYLGDTRWVQGVPVPREVGRRTRRTTVTFDEEAIYRHRPRQDPEHPLVIVSMSLPSDLDALRREFCAAGKVNFSVYVDQLLRVDLARRGYFLPDAP